MAMGSVRGAGAAQHEDRLVEGPAGFALRGVCPELREQLVTTVEAVGKGRTQIRQDRDAFVTSFERRHGSAVLVADLHSAQQPEGYPIPTSDHRGARFR